MTDHDAIEHRKAPGMASSDWAGEGSRRWLEHADRLEAMLAPIDDILLPAAGLQAGQRVLDVGCGRGVTARAAARSVGSSGEVTGVDVAAAVIAEAAAVTTAPDAAPVTWVAADAASHPFPEGRFHRIISRFGVMFFDDPVAGFTNLRRATRPHDGRLVVAVWQPRDASEFQSLAVDLAVRVAANHGHQLHPDPPDVGPFAYGLPAYVTEILEKAGWADVTFTPHDLTLYLGGPGTTPEQAVAMGRNFGPLGILLNDAPPAVAAAITEALTDELTSRWDGTGIPLPAAVATVTARPSPR